MEVHAWICQQRKDGERIHDIQGQSKLLLKKPDPGNVILYSSGWIELRGDIVTHGGNGGHDEREAVMIAELDEHGCLMKMICGGALSERMRCQLMGCLT